MSQDDDNLISSSSYQLGFTAITLPDLSGTAQITDSTDNSAPTLAALPSDTSSTRGTRNDASYVANFGSAPVYVAADTTFVSSGGAGYTSASLDSAISGPSDAMTILKGGDSAGRGDGPIANFGTLPEPNGLVLTAIFGAAARLFTRRGKRS